MGKFCFVENTDIITFNDHSLALYQYQSSLENEIIDYLTSNYPKKTLNIS